jgi:hypothetical protein
MKTNSISPETIITIAQIIGRCDFRTTVSRYTTSTNSPWVITVGELSWQRHLLVESVSVGEGLFRANATLAILAQSESDKFGYHIDTRKIEKRIELSELVAGHYISVKKALFPPKTKKATVTLEQLKAMFVGK